MNFGLSGKVAVVTGGARGIGRAICLGLADEGVDVGVLDVLADGAEETAQMIRAKGRKASALKADLADPESIRLAFDKATAEVGAADILVCCAAITNNMATIAKMPVEKWNWELSVNLSGAFYCIKQVGPTMIERKWGRIVLISSKASVDGAFGQCSYASSKGGINALAKTTALEYGRFGVTANIVYPALVNTPATAGLPGDVVARITADGRRLQEPEEVASVVTFLVSDQARSITGAEIPTMTPAI